MTTRSALGYVNGTAAPHANESRPWLPEPDTEVLVISGSPALLGEVGRVSAAAAVGLVIAESVEQSGGQWNGVAAILIGGDMRGGLPGWNGPTIVVGLAEDAASMWLQASRLRADRVAVLPDSAQWLANYLARLRDPNIAAGVVGVVGGCGGAGASTFAALLAAGAVGRGVRTLLVDGDQWGGGLDVAVAGEELSGLKWPDLLNAAGAINPEQLSAALPALGGLALLSWGQPPDGGTEIGISGSRGVAVTVSSEVLQAAREAFDLVVVDLGRSPDAIGDFGIHCDGFVMVVPGRLAAVAAAARVLRELPAAPVGLVARGPLRDGVDAQLLAESVGVPCVGFFPIVKKIAQTLEEGGLHEIAGRRRVLRSTNSVLDWMDGSGKTASQRNRGNGRRRGNQGRRSR